MKNALLHNCAELSLENFSCCNRHGHQHTSLIQLHHHVLIAPQVSANGTRLAQRLDGAKYPQFLDEREQVHAQFGALQASADHDLWLSTAEPGYVDDPRSLAVRFPATAGVTDLTTQTVSTVMLKRMNGKTRWDASRNLRQQVLAAAGDANAEKALGLLAARYRITNQTVLDDPFSRQVDEFLRRGMADVEELKKLRISGSRTVTLEQTTTQYVRPKASSLAKSSGLGGLNALMLWLNLISLKAAYANVQRDASLEYTAGFTSAILGTIASVAATLVSVRATQKMLMLKLSTTVPGMSFGNGILGIIASNSFTRFVGYPAIIFGFISDVMKAKRQAANGDEIAAVYTGQGGFLVMLGSAAMLEGSLAIAGITSIIPFFGWAAAAVVLAGAAVLAGGLALHAKASERIHTPIEFWAARCIFGSRINDGEMHPGVALDYNNKLPTYSSVSEEIRFWYDAYYAPLLLDVKMAKSLGLINLGSKWKKHEWFYPYPVNTKNPNGSKIDQTVEFSVLLRDYLPEKSTWSATMTHADSTRKHANTIIKNPICYFTFAGLVIHFKEEWPDCCEPILRVTYKPNQGLNETSEIDAQLKVDR